MWCAWMGLAVALRLAEAATQSTIELTAQYSSSTCDGPPTFVTIKESPSCVASTCSKDLKTATSCSSEDTYHSAVSNLFGNTRFIIRESYGNANCTAFHSASALKLDDQCVQDGATRMFVRSQLASDGSISVQYFTDASCSQDRLHRADFVAKATAEEHSCDHNASRWYVSEHDRRSLARTASSTDEEEDSNTGTEGTDATSPPAMDEADGGTNTNSATDEEDPNAGAATSRSADTRPDEDEADTSSSSDKGSDTAERTPTPTEAPTTEAPSTEPPTTAPTTTPPTTTEPPVATSAPDPTEALAVTTATPKVKKVSSAAGEAVASTTSTTSSTPSGKMETTDEATEDSVKGASASGSKAAATSTESSNGTTLTLIGIAAGCIALAIIILALIVRRLRAEHKSFHNATPAPGTTRREVRDPYAMQTSPFQPQRRTQRRYTTLAQKPYLLQEPTDDQPGQRPTQSIQEQPNPLENSVSALVAPAKQTEMWNDEVILANRIPKEKLQVQELISRSTFGEVYSGMYDRRRVAVKMLPPQMRLDVQLVNDLLSEAKRAATMRHPHIVSFIGVAWSALSDACVVMEYMDGGDLRSLLNDYEATRHPVGFDNEKATIAMHVCQALAYMHSLSTPMIHRDLKSRNILLNQAMEAKLMDFGISREKLDETMAAGVGTSLWIAPEVLMGNSYDDKADIFSFGVVLSELDTHQLPYANATAGGSQMACAVMLQKVVAGALQVEFSQQGCQTMAELGRACTSVDPDRRPKAAEILYILQDVLSEELLECSL